MNQPPGIGSWGLGLGFSLSVGDATRGVAMPGKTSEPYDNMVAKEVGTYDDILRTCDDLDDLDEWVVATVTAKVRGRTIFDCRGDYTCSSLYNDLERLCGDIRGQGIDEVVYDISSQDHAIFSKFASALEALVSSLEVNTFTPSTVANETSTIESGDATLSDDIDDAFDVDAPEALERFVMNDEASEHSSMLGDVREHYVEGTSPWSSKPPSDIDVGECDINGSDMRGGAPLIPDGTTLTTTGTMGQSLDTGTVHGNYGDPPSPTVVDEHARRAAWKRDLSDETQLPDSVGSTISHVMGPLLQCDDSTNHLSCSGTQRGTHTDCSYPTVGNVFDFDDPSDRNLGDGARRPISDIDVNRLSTVNSRHSLDPNRLGKLQIISPNTLGSLMTLTTSPGQPSDHFWKYSMMNGQLGSCGDACEVGTRGFTALGKKGLEYFDATRPPGAAAA